MHHDPRRIAGERSHRNRFSATHQGVLEDPAKIDETGVRGEQEFARVFGIKGEIESKKPTPYNFKLADGTRVDVRASHHRDPSLIVNPKSAARTTVDVYVLVEVNYERKQSTIIGWATADAVRAVTPRLISSRRGATEVHCLSRRELNRDIEELLDHHRPHTLRLL